MADLLLQAAQGFKAFAGSDYRYCLDCEIVFDVTFREAQFYHLAGLHYLSDVAQLAGSGHPINKRSVFKQILAEKISYNNIANSAHLHRIIDRLRWFGWFGNVIETRVIIDFDHTKVKGSKLLAKYLLYCYLEQEQVYLIVPLRYDEKLHHRQTGRTHEFV